MAPIILFGAASIYSAVLIQLCVSTDCGVDCVCCVIDRLCCGIDCDFNLVHRGRRFRQVCLGLVAEVVRSLTDGVALGIQLLAECVTLGVQLSAQLVALVVTDLLVFGLGLVLELAALARLNLDAAVERLLWVEATIQVLKRQFSAIIFKLNIPTTADSLLWVDKSPPGYESQSKHLTGSSRPKVAICEFVKQVHDATQPLNFH